MLPFNIFSIHDLISVMVTAPLAVIFYLSYFLLGRHKLDVLYGNLTACYVVFCCAIFLMDNVVPAGVPSSQVANASLHTLWLMQIMCALGLLGTVCLLHFALQCCGKNRIGPMRIEWAYVIVAALVWVVWTPWFLTPRMVPLAETSSWLYVVPYIPEQGLLCAVYLVTWISGNALAMYTVWRHQIQMRRQADGAFAHITLVLTGTIVALVAGAMDAVGGLVGLHASVAVAPIGITVMGVLMATAVMLERVRAERARQQLGLELALASRIQQGLLPESPPEVDGFELAGWSQSASETGGDTYDFMVLPDQQVMVTLGDAAGHGMGPALMIAQTRAVLRAFALGQRDPAIILRDAAQLLIMDMPPDRMVTCLVGIIDSTSAILSYASAGQGPILFFRRRTGEFEEVTATGPPLSPCLPVGAGPEARRFEFEQGDFVVLASDGFFEAPNLVGQRLGTDRFVEALRAERHGSAASLIAAARAQVHKFVEGADQEDDMTIVVVRKT